MATRVKLIEVILTKMEQISDHQLEDVLGYVEKIEQMNDQKKHILSFAGSWKDIDADLFSELTEKLPEMRLKESTAD